MDEVSHTQEAKENGAGEEVDESSHSLRSSQDETDSATVDRVEEL